MRKRLVTIPFHVPVFFCPLLSLMNNDLSQCYVKFQWNVVVQGNPSLITNHLPWKRLSPPRGCSRGVVYRPVLNPVKQEEKHNYICVSLGVFVQAKGKKTLNKMSDPLLSCP
jgi:hypothetical protein